MTISVLIATQRISEVLTNLENQNYANTTTKLYYIIHNIFAIDSSDFSHNIYILPEETL